MRRSSRRVGVEVEEVAEEFVSGLSLDAVRHVGEVVRVLGHDDLRPGLHTCSSHVPILEIVPHRNHEVLAVLYHGLRSEPLADEVTLGTTEQVEAISELPAPPRRLTRSIASLRFEVVVGKKQDAAFAKEQKNAAAMAVLVTTGDVQAKYQPVNIVFAVGGSAGGLFQAASPQLAFEAARFQLQLAALTLGGNAVVCCRFGYESHATSNLGCSGTAFTVSGYGTVVRFT